MKIFKVKNLNRKKIITAFLVGLFILSALTVIDSSFASSNSGSHASASASTDSFTFPYQYGTPVVPSDIGAQGSVGPHGQVGPVNWLGKGLSLSSYETTQKITLSLKVYNGSVTSNSIAEDQAVYIDNVTNGTIIQGKTNVYGFYNTTITPGWYCVKIIPTSKSFIEYKQILSLNKNTNIVRYLLPSSESHPSIDNGAIATDNLTWIIPYNTYNFYTNLMPDVYMTLYYNSNLTKIASAVTNDSGYAVFDNVSANYSYSITVDGYSNVLNGVVYSMANYTQSGLSQSKAGTYYMYPPTQEQVGLTSGNATMIGASNGYDTGTFSPSEIKNGMEILSSPIYSNSLVLYNSTVYINDSSPKFSPAPYVYHLSLYNSTLILLSGAFISYSIISSNSMIIGGITSNDFTESGSINITNSYIIGTGFHANNSLWTKTDFQFSHDYIKNSYFPQQGVNEVPSTSDKVNVSYSCVFAKTSNETTFIVNSYKTEFLNSVGNFTFTNDSFRGLSTVTPPFTLVLLQFYLANGSSIKDSYINGSIEFLTDGNNVTFSHNIIDNESYLSEAQINAYQLNPFVFSNINIDNNTFGAMWDDWAWENVTGGGSTFVSLFSSENTGLYKINVSYNTFYEYPAIAPPSGTGQGIALQGYGVVTHNVFYNNQSYGPNAYESYPGQGNISNGSQVDIMLFGQFSQENTYNISCNYFLNLNNGVMPIFAVIQNHRSTASIYNNYFYYKPLYGFGVTSPIPVNYFYSYQIGVGSKQKTTISGSQYIYNSTREMSLRGPGVPNYIWNLTPDVNTLSGTPVISYNNGYVGGPQPNFIWKGYNYTESVEPTYIQVGVNSSKAPSIGIAFNGVAGELYHVQVINGNDVIQNISVVANSNGVVQVTYNPSTMPLDPIFNLIPPPSPSSPIHVILKKALSYTKLIAISVSLLVIVVVAYFYTKSSGGKSGSGGGERRI